MAKFSDRQKNKIKKTKKGSVKYALGCLIIFVAIPLTVVGMVLAGNAQREASQRNRVKTQFEEGLKLSFSKQWVLVGHEFTPESKNFTINVISDSEEIPDNLTVQYRKKGAEEFLGTIPRIEANKYQLTVNSEDFGAGVLAIEAVATSEEVAGKKWTSEEAKINLSYGLYVVWTMDWEGQGVAQGQLDQMSRISTDHHNLPLTHFFNPRVFSGGVGGFEGQKQMNYVKARRDQFGDEIGLHLHMWYDVPRAAGVNPRTEPAWNSKDLIGGGGGYDVPFSAYTYEESLKILKWSAEKFEQNGLGKPLSFRAGGWYLSLDNVKALQDAGYRVDSSGRDARFWGRGYLASPWSLGSRTQPYKISTESLNSDFPEPRYNVWEIPNNGADSYWFSAQDMITALNDNFQNKPLTERRIVNILSHPHWFSVDYPKLQEFFADADTKFYPEDKGPVLYTTLKDYLVILDNDPDSKYK